MFSSLDPFVYESPADRGFTRYKLSRKDHKAIIGPLYWTGRAEYWVKEDYLYIEQFHTWPAKLLETLLLPLHFILKGTEGVAEFFRHQPSLWNQKKYGSFVSQSIWKTKDAGAFERFMQHAKKV